MKQEQVMTEQITQGNELIAVFMGYERYEDSYGVWFKKEGLIISMHPKLGDLKYHSLWDWLMPVVVNITTMNHGSYGITVDPFGIEIRDYSEENEPLIKRIENDDSYPLMEMYYSIVVEFIEWYNLNNTTKPQP